MAAAAAATSVDASIRSDLFTPDEAATGAWAALVVPLSLVALREGDGCACAAKHTKTVEVVMRAGILTGVTFDLIGNMEACL